MSDLVHVRDRETGQEGYVGETWLERWPGDFERITETPAAEQDEAPSIEPEPEPEPTVDEQPAVQPPVPVEPVQHSIPQNPAGNDD